MKFFLSILVWVLSQTVSIAQTSQIPSLSVGFTEGGESYAVPIQVLILFTLLTFVPAMLVSVTSFTRIVIVAHFLRQAIGTHSVPSNQVILGLALFLTFFVMGPTWDDVYETAVLPYQSGKLDIIEALKAAVLPLREFMMRQVREADLALFLRIGKLPQPSGPDELPLRVIIPAFMISELKTAFQIGFVLFIPFLVIDMVISSILLSTGMMMLPPIIISAPFKLLLFVLVDGWNLVIGSLLSSFH